MSDDTSIPREISPSSTKTSLVETSLHSLHRLVLLHGEILDELAALSSPDAISTRVGGMDFAIDVDLSVDTTQPPIGQHANTVYLRKSLAALYKSIEERLNGHMNEYEEVQSVLLKNAKLLDKLTGDTMTCSKGEGETSSSSTTKGETVGNEGSSQSSTHLTSPPTASSPSPTSPPSSELLAFRAKRDALLAECSRRNGELHDLLLSSITLRRGFLSGPT